MPNEYEIILRYSPAGWLGILMIKDYDGLLDERYRTELKTGPVAALTAVQFWMQSNL